jgi:predicted Zn-dependent protease
VDFYVASEQWTKAADVLRRLLKVAPREPHVACQLAEAQFHLGHDDDALENARRELSHDKNCGAAHFVLGKAMVKYQNRRDAVEHLTAAVRLLPHETDPIVYLAQAYLEDTSFDEGQRVLIELLKNQPDNPHAHYMLGFCYARNVAEPDHERKAEDALNEALRLNPHHHGAHFELGRLFLLRGQPAPALPHLQTAARLNPNYPPTFLLLAQVYRRLGQTDKTGEAQKRFEELNRREVERSTRARRAATSSAELDAGSRTPHSEDGLFTDVAAQAGINFVHSNGATRRHYFVETTGSGCAFFDYDNDGWLDVLLMFSSTIRTTTRNC